MEYITIEPNTEGHWLARDDDVDPLTLVGPEGHNRITLRRDFSSAGWVNDMGHVRPEDFPRNVFGSCVLVALGAAVRPYAGTVVITGWDLTAEREVVDLDTERIENVCEAVRLALGIDPDPDGAIHPSQWARDIRAFAEKVPTMPAPTMRFVGGTL
ncbi:hypothetical protein [Nocardiopsis sp. NPDC057823]|uniref:hypothetical protein n=1 Tax=Nocardiopsis sp. NPDC057823 TaxID=3346256 RepID=UPI00366D590A